MQKVLLVDGYNIIHGWKKLKELSEQNLESARDRLIELLADYQGYTNQHIIIVFDAYNVKGIGQAYQYNPNVDIIFTKEAETADQYIERTALQITKKYTVRVATSDHVEQVIILGAGATRISAKELEIEVKRARDKGKKYLKNNESIKNNPLENWMDEKVRQKMEALRRSK